MMLLLGIMCLLIIFGGLFLNFWLVLAGFLGIMALNCTI